MQVKYITGVVLLLALGTRAHAQQNDLLFIKDQVTVQTGAVVTVQGGITVSTSGSLLHNGQITLTGNWLNSSNTAVFGNMDAGTVSFIGATSQTIGSTGGQTRFPAIVFNNLSVVQPAISVISNPSAVQVNATFTNGIVSTTPDSKLIFLNGATATGDHSTAYVDGPVQKIGNAAFVFPIGSQTKWARLGISAPSEASTAFTAWYHNQPPANRSILGAGLNNPGAHISNKEWWELSRDAGIDNVNVTLYWESHTESGIVSTLPADLVVAHYNGTQWVSEGNTAATGPNPSGTLSSGVVSSFSPFTFGAPTIVNPLPLKLLDFTGKLVNKYVMLNWTTTNEVNTSHFDVERSSNGSAFDKIGSVTAENDASRNSKYQYRDDKLPAELPVLFYRLKMSDRDGRFSHSPIVSVRIPATAGIQLAQNPVHDNIRLLINGSMPGNLRVRVHTVAGQEVVRREIAIPAGANTITIDRLGHLLKGVYILTVLSGDNSILMNERLIKD